MRVYLDTVGPYREAITRDAGQRDLNALVASLHALKSSSRTIGGNTLGDLADEAEKLARKGDQKALNLVPTFFRQWTPFATLCRRIRCWPTNPPRQNRNARETCSPVDQGRLHGAQQQDAVSQMPLGRSGETRRESRCDWGTRGVPLLAVSLFLAFILQLFRIAWEEVDGFSSRWRRIVSRVPTSENGNFQHM
jgi:HPt (histidine-containing phosphotransfer) domain-containing protein